MEQNGATTIGEDKRKGKFRSQAPIAKFPLEISGGVT